MRDLKAADYRRNAIARPRQSRVTSVGFDRVPGLGSGEVRLEPFLTVIAGANGAGKSSLLNIVHAAVAPFSDGTLDFISRRLRGARLCATIDVDGKNNDFIVSVNTDGSVDISGDPVPSFDIVYLDLADEARQLISWARKAPLDQHLESLAPRESPEKERFRIGRLVRKDYAAILTYEIELAERSPFPYFKVREAWQGAPIYGAESMGQGETILHVLEWHLRQLNPGSLVLLEEPDAHITDVSQGALLDSLALTGTNTGCTFVATTHSSRIVTEATPQSIRVVFRESDGVRVLDDPSLSLVAQVLGMRTPKSRLVVCEDGIARDLSLALLRRSEAPFAATVEVVSQGSEAHVRATLTNTPETSEWFSLAGVFDGDCRTRQGAAPTWSFVFLPGDQAPEVWLRRQLEAAKAAGIPLFGVTSASLSTMLSSLSGVDPHDWLRELATRLGRTPTEVVNAVVDAWSELPGAKDIVETFADDLEVALQAFHELRQLTRRGSGLADKTAMITKLQGYSDRPDLVLGERVSEACRSLIALLGG